MSPEGWLVWVNRVYFGAAAVAILATAVTVVAGVTQSRLNETLAKRKDREFAQFKLASDAKIADLHRQTAEANQKSEQDRLVRVKIEGKLAWRAVSSEQTAQIVAVAAKYPATPADLFIVGDSPEVINLGQSMLDMLRAARWNVTAWSWTGIGALPGIAVLTKPDADEAQITIASALVKGLLDAGLVSVATKWPGSSWKDVPGTLNGPPFDGNRAQIRVIVGTKPPL